jgi:hypothetical protein
MTCRHVTTDHNEIRLWIQTHHGAPGRITPPARADDAQLCIDFLGLSTPSLEHLGWQDWFTAFDAQLLALSYPDTAPSAGPGRWELVHRPHAR